MSPSTPRRARRRSSWARLPDERLLDLRLRDLGLRLRGTELEGRVARLHEELRSRSISFRPHVWLSTEWFSPDGVPGIAVPFFLAHPRLSRLERSKMLEVEGGTERHCMQLLRHEAGHAIDTAYRLHRRKRWREVFGRYSTPYQTTYTPRPYSKRFVLHLDLWYAQSHPAEDFAETFAVWLRPRSDWKRRYARWPALKKLSYVDELMHEIAGTPPAVRCREQTESIGKLSTTLREYYEAKLRRYGSNYPDFYDRDLRRLFPDPAGAGGVPAASFLKRARPHLRRVVAQWTGQYRYTIDLVLLDMIERCDALGLALSRPEDQALADATVLLTVQTMNYLHGGNHTLVR